MLAPNNGTRFSSLLNKCFFSPKTAFNAKINAGVVCDTPGFVAVPMHIHNHMPEGRRVGPWHGRGPWLKSAASGVACGPGPRGRVLSFDANVTIATSEMASCQGALYPAARRCVFGDPVESAKFTQRGRTPTDPAMPLAKWHADRVHPAVLKLHFTVFEAAE